MKVIFRMVVDVVLPPSSGESAESSGTTQLVVEKFLDLTQIPRVGDRVMIQGDNVMLIPYVKEVYWLYPELFSKSNLDGAMIILGLNRPIISVEEQLIRLFFDK